MPKLKKMKLLTNLGSRAASNSKKCKHEHLEEKENSHVLRKASAIKSKSTSSCEVMPRLTGESSASSPVTLTECETEREIRHDVRETVAVDLDAKNDVDMAENTPQSEVVDMGGSDDDKEPEIEFRYEKIGTYSFPPTIVSEAEAAFVDIITVLFLRHS